MNERLAGRLELTGARARSWFRPASEVGGSTESTGGSSGAPNAADAKLIAARITAESSLDAAAAAAAAASLVAQARTAVARLDDEHPALTAEEAVALEAVIQVRGRPAVRVLDDRLEALDRHPGAELWELFVADFEDRIIAAAVATGAAFASAPETGHPAWVQGSAWLIAKDLVVTNRHVLLTDELALIEPDGAGKKMRFKAGNSLTIEFAHDSRVPAASIRHAVTRVLYVAGLNDPVDVAVLAIEPTAGRAPLALIGAGDELPDNLFVVGHPAPMFAAPTAVAAVFGKPDGKKRVSFGKRLEPSAPRPGELVHDASTIGGYSGGPVLDISRGGVAGLHYYGDPVGGNLAIASDALRAHEAFGHWPK